MKSQLPQKGLSGIETGLGKGIGTTGMIQGTRDDNELPEWCRRDQHRTNRTEFRQAVVACSVGADRCDPKASKVSSVEVVAANRPRGIVHLGPARVYSGALSVQRALRAARSTFVPRM